MTASDLILHSSLKDPVLGSMNFLNEIMSRYPEAISFAPGAPNLAFLDDFDITSCINDFVEYVAARPGFDLASARRLLYEYGPSKGVLNELVATALGADDRINVDPASIVITVGAQEAMVLVLRALIRSPLDRLAVVSPSYVGLIGAARLLDINVVPITETENGPDLDELSDAIAGARADGATLRALCISPDYANPSGVVMMKPARDRLLELAEREDFLLIEDSAYAFTAGFPDAIPSLKALDRARRVIHIGTFSKICMPGPRVGFVIADQVVKDPDGRHEVLANALGRLKSMVTVNTSPICQAIVGGMLLRHGGSIRALGRAKADFYRTNLSVLIASLDRTFTPLSLARPSITWTRPRGGFFARLRLPIPVDTTLLERFGRRIRRSMDPDVGILCQRWRHPRTATVLQLSDCGRDSRGRTTAGMFCPHRVRRN